MPYNYKKVFIFVLFASLTFSQVDNVSADHQVYSFLKVMKVKGLLPEYNDFILPHSRMQIKTYFDSLLIKKDQLSEVEKELLKKYIIQLAEYENVKSLIPDYEETFKPVTKALYSYKDDLVFFSVNPIIEYKYLNSSSEKSSAGILNFGGRARGSYKDILGFNVVASNGAVFHERDSSKAFYTPALFDRRVAQSYTFNQTSIDYFDYTEGYIKYQHDIFDVELGRERILWGSGYNGRSLLSENPQIFDFVKFHLKYKALSYDFLHGWLVTRQYLHIDPIFGGAKAKIPKYLALSRLGINFSESYKLGLSQIIVYSNRPFEPAYLNPFLFYESAQRSLNDLDNSYLSIDFAMNPLNGFELSSSFTIDDINFQRYISGKWTNVSNAFQINLSGFLTYPLFFVNGSLKADYFILRPFMFSHQGQLEALSFSNNGYLLSFVPQPNSITFSLSTDYYLTDYMQANVAYTHYKHGNNIYENGVLVENNGGNALEPYDGSKEFIKLLEGDLEVVDIYKAGLNYEFFYNFYLGFNYFYQIRNFQNNKENKNYFSFEFKLNLN